MGYYALNTVEEMTRAVEDMEKVIRQLKTELALIRQLAGREEARDFSGVSCKRRKARRALLARTIPN